MMIRLSVLLLCLIAAAGCGPAGEKLVPAKGVVRFVDGKPLAGGMIEFIPKQPKSSTQANPRAKINPDGTFVLETGGKPGAYVGSYQVMIIPMVIADGAGAHVGAHHAKLVIHPKYAKYETSGLHADVLDQTENQLPFIVEPAAGGRGW